MAKTEAKRNRVAQAVQHLYEVGPTRREELEREPPFDQFVFFADLAKNCGFVMTGEDSTLYLTPAGRAAVLGTLRPEMLPGWERISMAD